MIAGDLNGDTGCFDTIATMLNTEGWTDVGADAYLWGKDKHIPTCHTNAAAKQTRIGYIIVNEHLLPAIVDYRVDQSDEFAIHTPAQVKSALGNLNFTKRKLRKAQNMVGVVQEKIEDITNKHRDSE